MAKAKNPRRVGDKEARAKLRMIRISPQKLNLVAQLIRGKKVDTALADLEFSHEAYVGKNFVMKRFRARARGRGARILKPFSELTIVVREVEDAPEETKKSEAA